MKKLTKESKESVKSTIDMKEFSMDELADNVQKYNDLWYMCNSNSDAEKYKCIRNQFIAELNKRKLENSEKYVAGYGTDRCVMEKDICTCKYHKSICKNDAKSCMCSEHIRDCEKKSVGEYVLSTCWFPFLGSISGSLLLILFSFCDFSDHPVNSRGIVEHVTGIQAYLINNIGILVLIVFTVFYLIGCCTIMLCDDPYFFPICGDRRLGIKKRVVLKFLMILAIIDGIGLSIIFGLFSSWTNIFLLLLGILLLTEAFILRDKKRPKKGEDTFKFTLVRKLHWLMYGLLIIPIMGFGTLIIKSSRLSWIYLNLNLYQIINIAWNIFKWIIYAGIIIIAGFLFIKLNELHYKNNDEDNNKNNKN
jgi:hypothetical protein